MTHDMQLAQSSLTAAKFSQWLQTGCIGKKSWKRIATDGFPGSSIHGRGVLAPGGISSELMLNL
jgi:hypothetical protein